MSQNRIPASRFARMNDVLSDVTGLELWLTGEVDFDQEVVENMFYRVKARLLVIQRILEVEGERCEGSSPAVQGSDSQEA